MTESFWRRAAVWLEQWMQPLAFASLGYLPMQNGEQPLDLKDQLEEILACVREEELKWRIREQVRKISKRPPRR